MSNQSADSISENVEASDPLTTPRDESIVFDATCADGSPTRVYRRGDKVGYLEHHAELCRFYATGDITPPSPA